MSEYSVKDAVIMARCAILSAEKQANNPQDWLDIHSAWLALANFISLSDWRTDGQLGK